MSIGKIHLVSLPLSEDMSSKEIEEIEQKALIPWLSINYKLK